MNIWDCFSSLLFSLFEKYVSLQLEFMIRICAEQILVSTCLVITIIMCICVVYTEKKPTKRGELQNQSSHCSSRILCIIILNFNSPLYENWRLNPAVWNFKAGMYSCKVEAVAPFEAITWECFALVGCVWAVQALLLPSASTVHTLMIVSSGRPGSVALYTCVVNKKFLASKMQQNVLLILTCPIDFCM